MFCPDFRNTTFNFDMIAIKDVIYVDPEFYILCETLDGVSMWIPANVLNSTKEGENILRKEFRNGLLR